MKFLTFRIPACRNESLHAGILGVASEEISYGEIFISSLVYEGFETGGFGFGFGFGGFGFGFGFGLLLISEVEPLPST
ncbi:MAG: hypothetical protein ABIT76_06075 [Chthoniobacterales bacterium]